MKTLLLRMSLLAKYLLIAAPLALAPLAGLQVNQEGVQWQWQTAHAQDDDDDEDDEPASSQPRTRRAQAVSERVNKILAKISEMLNPEDASVKPDYQGALRELLDINHSKWSDYERAQVYSLLGGVYVNLENYPEATKYYRLYYDTPTLAEAQRLNISTTLAQLYMVQENFKEAIRLLEEYIAKSEIVGGDKYFLLGSVYYQDQQLDKALPNVDKAIQMYEESDRLPKESWYQYQYALYFEKENYKKVITILEKMVRHYPKMQTWKVLAQVYGSDNRIDDQRHTFDAIYKMGGLTDEKSLLVLASLYLEAEYPVKAAKVLEKGMKDGIIQETSKNLQTLGIAWSLSRENQKAIPAMAKAAEKSDDGELYARLAQIYLSRDSEEDYKNAVNAGKEALQRSLKKPADVHMTLGMAYFNMDQFDTALESFKEARKNKEFQKQANTWITVAESEKARVEKLAAAQQ